LLLEQPRLKVIYTSGYSADTGGTDFRLRPGKAFIQKPYTTENLLKTIRQCLED
jgi:hypothetical protein